MVSRLAQMIEVDMDEIAQQHLDTVAARVAQVLGAIEADLSTMTAAGTAVLVEYPEVRKSVTRMLRSVKETSKKLQAEVEGQFPQTEQLGSI